MEDLSLHILDIVENSVTAGAQLVSIVVCEDKKKDLLTIEIVDDGEGMSAKTLEKADDPFFTEKTTRRVGLGLSLLRQAAEMANGAFSITSEEGKGTTVRATFQHSHIDRQPLGDMKETVETLVVGNPSVDFLYERKRNGGLFRFDTRMIKKELSGSSMSSPKGIRMVRDHLKRFEETLSEGKRNE
jgi:anti-sigma regulatory factor (Ser/Thr protein kinase)